MSPSTPPIVTFEFLYYTLLHLPAYRGICFFSEPLTSPRESETLYDPRFPLAGSIHRSYLVLFSLVLLAILCSPPSMFRLIASHWTRTWTNNLALFLLSSATDFNVGSVLTAM